MELLNALEKRENGLFIEMLASFEGNINEPPVNFVLGKTFLHAACLASCAEETVRALLAAGADANVRDACKCTPLHYAFHRPSKSRLVCVRALIAAGANVRAQDDHECEPLHYAVSSQTFDRDCVQLLIDSGADIDAQCKSGYTPLHYACVARQVGAVKFLLENGANMYIQSHLGVTCETITTNESINNLLAQFGGGRTIKQPE